MSRIAIGLVLAVVLIGQTALAEDPATLLQKGREAEYSGEQVVTCNTPDGVVDAVAQIRQSGGVLTVEVPGSVEGVVAGIGTWTATDVEGATQTIKVAASPSKGGAVRYTASFGAEVVFLERRASEVEINRAEELRARMVVDAESGVILRTEILNGDGSVYCDTRFVSFTSGDGGGEPVEVDQVVEVEPAGPEAAKAYPNEVAGFTLRDVYVWDERTTWAYYSDGFFSFTVLSSPRAITLEGTEKGKKVDGYRRTFRPGQAVYVWESSKGGHALMGNLPVDLQQKVLKAFPVPGKPVIFVRIWRQLFG